LNHRNADKWEQRYGSGEAALQPPHPLVMRAAELLPAGYALDLACGLGRHALALAARGWEVLAVDRSLAALAQLDDHAVAQKLKVATLQADLESEPFELKPDSFDLIVMTCYLQRDLFVTLREALRVGGLFVAVIALVDDHPHVKPMNLAFLLQPGELASYFYDWELIYSREGKPSKDASRRATAEIIARRI
jgi:tellurite methyltransferase